MYITQVLQFETQG